MKNKISGLITGITAFLCCISAAAVPYGSSAEESLSPYYKEISLIKGFLLTDENCRQDSSYDVNFDGKVNVFDLMRYKRVVLLDEELPEKTVTDIADTTFEVFPGRVLCPNGSIVPVNKAPDINAESAGLEYPGNGIVFDITGEEGDWYKASVKIFRSDRFGTDVYIEKDNIFFDRKADSWQQKYSEIIALKQNAYKSTHDADSDRYALCDITGDGIPELFFRTRDNSTDSSFGEVYSVYNGFIISRQIRGLSAGVSLVVPETNSMVISNQHIGKYEKIVRLENGKFTDGPEFVDYLTDVPEHYTIDGTDVSEDVYRQKRSEYITDNTESVSWTKPDDMLSSLNPDAEYPELITEIPAGNEFGYATVTRKVTVRSMPSEDGKELGTIDSFGVVSIQEKTGDWYRILYKVDYVNGQVKSAYIPADSAAFILYPGSYGDVYSRMADDTVKFLKTSGINDDQFLLDNLLGFSVADLNGDNKDELIVMSSYVSGNGPYVSFVISREGSKSCVSRFFPDSVTGIAEVNGNRSLMLSGICRNTALRFDGKNYFSTEFTRTRLQDSVCYINGTCVPYDKYSLMWSEYEDSVKPIKRYGLAEFKKMLELMPY